MHFPIAIAKGRPLKMKLKCMLLIAAFGLLAATASAEEPKSYRLQLSAAKVGTAALDGGQYKLFIHRDGSEPTVRFIHEKTGNEISVPAKVESGDRKYPQTEVHTTTEVNGAPQILEIRIGGTTLRVSFQQGT